MKTIFFWITTLAFILAGCQDGKIQQPEPPLIQPASPTPAASTVPTRTLRVEIAATIQPPADSPGEARSDLAERLGIPAGEIMILAVINQDFSPAGFYCRSSKERTSKEGVVESIAGQTILLQALENRYEYHADGQRVVFCRKLR